MNDSQRELWRSIWQFILNALTLIMLVRFAVADHDKNLQDMVASGVVFLALWNPGCRWDRDQ